ncbi:hypothetical protein K4K49_008053 [Colletotrichum sp. SAR 10_70]|nr:hypothetical protein K4K49_008053 [Colletotrichum sp. SAR 10_70]KAJ5005135.1 hypothetical protein K4K48_008018 [Colletotrichum sp. SAR 10_66]
MDTYDYVIIGGGTAGMTLASRLSAVPENTVLVVEAGSLYEDRDNYEAAVMIPRFYPGASGFAPGTRYDWNLTTVPQTFLQGQTSETFTAATPEHASLYGLTHDPACHGYEGPVQSSYLAWSHPNNMNPGIPANSDLDNATFDAEQRDLYYAERKGRWTDTIAEALAFIPLYNFTEADLSNNLISTVVAGYEKQTGLIASMHSKGATAAMELLYVDGGRSVVNILMHPLSRGTVSITSSDPFAPPVIDPRKLLATTPIQALGATETLPGTATESDADILSFIKGVTSTEYHYVGTCAMLPKALGGVVDAELKVYGVDGLRVVDASIMPLLPSAHTQATVYAIAEKAADIILGHSVEGRQ